LVHVPLFTSFSFRARRSATIVSSCLFIGFSFLRVVELLSCFLGQLKILIKFNSKSKFKK
jgi:hypothetical protein